ncbi:MAG: Rieske 2Fe-2S domain-containing protein [Anaerolineales bacterium]|nr:MAG: Rieske 2Fe-2S domain-containing protein [Anaerolineales bacterium]
MVKNYPSAQNNPESPDPQESGRYFRYMAQFVGFTDRDKAAIRESALIVEKHLPEIIGKFYTNLLQYPPTRRHFLASDGSVDDDYLRLRMYHQANFWRRVAGGVYDDEFAHFVDYVGRSHTSRGADKRVYIAERYVIGMVGFTQHAIINALIKELHEFDHDLEQRAIKAWNKLCMVILEMLARAYGHEREGEKFEDLLSVDPDEMHTMSIDSYEKSLGIQKILDYKDVLVANEDEIPEGERKIIEVDGIAIGVFHHKGKYFALQNKCLHRGGPVCTGKIEGDTITCPWHGYEYDLTNGSLLFDPAARLDMYPVTVKNGQLFLSFPVISSSLEDNIPDTEEIPSQETRPQASQSLDENEFFLSECPPGGKYLLHIDGQPVLVYNLSGKFYATQEKCTHVGGPLSEGELQEDNIICPWHGSCFSIIDGKVTCPPATKSLQTYQVQIYGQIGKVVI